MHTHLGFREAGFRAPMERGDLLLVAEKIVCDGPLLRTSGGRSRNTREARSGELRRYYEDRLARARSRWRREELVEVVSVQALDRVLKERVRGIVIAAEGADFLEGDLSYLEKAHADGLVHLQLVHYYAQSLIGDISSEEYHHGGLTPFGKDLVRACNRLGILVDVAHCSTPAMEQVLELSAKPVIYSHGQVSAALPDPSQNIVLARSIHEPVARKIAANGGVVGFWSNWYTFANTELFAEGLMRLADTLGPAHVGIGTDMNGMPRTNMPTYAGFLEIEEAMSKRGMKRADIDAILGGNYVRVLREAMTL